MWVIECQILYFLVYMFLVYADTGYSLEDLPEEMDDRGDRWERIREIRAGSVTWWS